MHWPQPGSANLVAGITGVSHCAQPKWQQILVMNNMYMYMFDPYKSVKPKQNNKGIVQICTYLSGFIRDLIVIAAFKRCLTSR
jgi:hypothetical protein